ncbi:DMT family transporter [Lentzea tibetensis]|uniref:DMT family transporter n=1 Tax=Lentzea tibetensis TaxID=2591470 RepID=A0A563EN45_9PSEU|nr:DMT family transporter [Lentzea tibetensis]TWP48606.1 DMT family transporter [Lentzea tibetensis]
MRLGVVAGAGAATIVGASVPVTGMLEGYPLLTGQAMRYALGAAVLLLVVLVSGKRLPLPALRDMPALLGLVATGMLGFNAVILAAQRYAEPGFVAAVLGASPIALALLAARRSAAAVVGAVVVGAGVVVLSGGGAWHGPGLALALLTMAGEVSFTVFAVGVVRRLGVLAVSTWTCLLAAVIGAVAGTFVGGWRMPDTRQLVALILLGTLLTAVAFGLWYFSVNTLGPDRAGVLIGMMPVSGLVTSVALGAQQLTLVSVLGALTVGLGCVIGLRRGRSANLSRGPLEGDTPETTLPHSTDISAGAVQ